MYGDGVVCVGGRSKKKKKKICRAYWAILLCVWDYVLNGQDAPLFKAEPKHIFEGKAKKVRAVFALLEPP